MPLQQGIELIVTVKNGARRYRCAAFDGFALPHPVLIQFEHVGSSASKTSMDRLAMALIAELQGAVGINRVQPPCGGSANGCHALDEIDCHRLLVLVGDGVTSIGAHQIAQQWLSASDNFQILPVLPEMARRMATALLPVPLDAINIAFWGQAIEEAMPAVFQVAGITAAQPRVFISYRQSDTASAAIQLFDALSHDGFDVFLDHFRTWTHYAAHQMRVQTSLTAAMKLAGSLS